MVGGCAECGSSVERKSGGVRSGQSLLCSDSCRSERKKKTYRKWQEKHRAQQRVYQSEYHKARKETHPDYFKRHYAANREKRRREAQEWYRANSGRALKNRQAYVEANRSRVRVWGRKNANKRRAIKKRVFVEVVDPLLVFARDKGKCGICMKRVEPDSRWEIDHIIPISRGGAHAYANVQLAHQRCNRSKHAKVPKGQRNLFQVVV